MASSKNFANWKVFVLGALSLALTACDKDVKIVDGHVPTEYLPYVQKLMGDYTGQFNRQANTLTARLSGDMVELIAQQDLLGSGCQTKIGKLLQISYDDNDGGVDQAVFELDANLCSRHVIGQKVFVTFKTSEPVKINISILDHYEDQWQCSNLADAGSATVYPGYPNPPYPAPHCWRTDVPVYMTGRFVKN